MAVSGGLRSVFALDTSGLKLGLNAAILEYNRRAKKAITKGALLLEREIKKELSKPGSGMINVGRSKSRKVKGIRVFSADKSNRRSAPGEPPAVDTGRLRASITHLVEKEFLAWTAQVGTNVEYAAALEFGRKDGSIEARPFMLTTLARIRPQMLVLFQVTLSSG